MVRDKIGGTLQSDEWAHIEDVHIVWNIGGTERANSLLNNLNNLNKAVSDVMDKRENMPKQSTTRHSTTRH